MNRDKWNENIETCKKLVSRKESQMEVARLALEVCEVSWGGSGLSKTLYTVKRFAEEINVNYKTLSGWIAIRKRVYNKLTPDLRRDAKVKDLIRAAKTIKANEPSGDVQNKVRNLVYNSVENKYLSYISSLRSLSVGIDDVANVLTLKKETLEEIKFHCESIIKSIDRNSPNKVVAREHNLASIYSSKRVGHEGPRNWVLSEADSIVLSKLDDNFVSPIVLGRKIFPTISKTAAKLRALRSLQKLTYMGKVTKNERGLYRLAPQKSEAY